MWEARLNLAAQQDINWHPRCFYLVSIKASRIELRHPPSKELYVRGCGVGQSLVKLLSQSRLARVKVRPKACVIDVCLAGESYADLSEALHYRNEGHYYSPVKNENRSFRDCFWDVIPGAMSRTIGIECRDTHAFIPCALASHLQMACSLRMSEPPV